MITSRLEDLIWNKKATYKTWTIGTGSAGLPVTSNKTIIVLGFDYYPFIDSETDGAGAGDRDEYNLRMNKAIIIQSKTSRHKFLARNYFQAPDGIRPDSHFFKCYLPFIDSITLDIITIPSPAQWTILSGFPLAKSEQPNIPLGYGNINTPGAIPSPLNVQFNDILDSEARPFKRDILKDVSFNDFDVAVSTETSIKLPDTDNNNIGAMQFPFVTVHYVEINERLTNTFV